ncbi:MAG: ribonuclease HII [Gemmatimonadaceae bacterium]|nr:ribonuclease HII [Gemmatimonadaceae bacterium]
MASSRKRWSAIERELRAQHGPLIAGVDEVGRGPLAGPVVACAVIMPADRRAIAGVDDSKRVAEPDRVRLARRIRDAALAIGVGAASVREIDTYNIYHASTRAIRRAIERLPVRPAHVVLDGNPIRTLGIDHTAVVGGDARCYAIACASIVAKVLRDDLMRRLARRYPAYGWERNAGYATQEHIAVLDAIGGTPHHRTSFRAKQLELLFDLDGEMAGASSATASGSALAG